MLSRSGCTAEANFYFPTGYRHQPSFRPAFRKSSAGAPIARERVPLKDHNGNSLYLERFSAGDGLEKRPLLMLHGLTYSSHEFDVDCKDYSLVRFLARNGYDVWLFDVAGYGRSDEVEDGFITCSDYAAENAASVARFVIDFSGCDRIDLFGWSWGGLCAGKFAIKYPELLRKLVLYAPLTSGIREKKIDAPFISDTWAHAADDFQTLADGSIDFDITEPEVVDLYVANCRRFDRNTCPNGGRREVMTSPSNRLLKSEYITSPTLVICGTHDQYCSIASCRELISRLPNKDSRLVIHDGGSHMMMIEKPFYRQFRQDVIDFLRS